MGELHLVRLAIDPAGLTRLARARALGDEDDAGYRLHAVVAGAFGAVAPAPWHLDTTASGRNLIVWAYASVPWDDLRRTAEQRFVDPVAAQLDPDLVSLLRGAIAWEGCASKAMPALAQGQRVAFTVRACATVRLRHDLAGVPATADHGAIKTHKDGEEVDACLAEALKRGVHPGHIDAQDARSVYTDWVARALARLDGLQWEQVRLTGYRQVQIRRKQHGRGTRKELHLPEVHAEGVAVVSDPVTCTQAIARGVGRHRAFGFGMLLLRPAAG